MICCVEKVIYFIFLQILCTINNLVLVQNVHESLGVPIVGQMDENKGALLHELK